MIITKKYIPFLSFWLLNFLILFIFSQLFPKNIVFGNGVLSGVFAVIWTSLILTFLGWIVKPVLSKIKITIEGLRNKMIFYFGINMVLIWILARIPDFTGFGISRFTWAIILGIFLELVQWRVWELLKAKKLA